MAKVLVHGNPETDAIWGPLVAALADRGVDDVVLLSPPGFGAPAPEGWQATRTDYADWLVGELERIGGDVDLLGHDWGAGHVFGVAATRPDLLRSWAADCAGLLHPDYVWHELAQGWQQPEVGEAIVATMEGMALEERVAAYEGLGLPPEVAASMASAVDADMGRCILALYRSAAQPAMVGLGDALASAEPRPALVVDPTADPYVPSVLSQAVADRLGARTLRLEGLGHWWMLADPSAAADGLASFWDGR
jgi:pimeloyl-ACP methyl ester carboxylesterase